MATAVQVRIQDDSPLPQAIAGVVVQVFTTLGIFLTSGTTDGSGSVSFLLLDGTYNLLFYKQGVSILPKQPQQIIVSSLAASNNFLAIGHISTLPESTDPARCRISGTLIGADGLPAQDLRISFRPCSDISVVGGSLVSVQSQFEVSPTERGYFQFDLIRGQVYHAYMTGIDKLPRLGIEPAKFLVIGPSLPAMALVDLLFPLPVLVEFSQNTISIPLAGGPDGSSTLGTIHYADGSSSGMAQNSRTRQPPFATLNYEYSDPTLFSIILANGSTQITPNRTGTGTVILTRTLPKSIFWPTPPPFTSETLTVTIT